MSVGDRVTVPPSVLHPNGLQRRTGRIAQIGWSVHGKPLVSWVEVALDSGESYVFRGHEVEVTS